MQAALPKPVLQLHWFIGVVFLLVFVLQGQFMSHVYNGLQDLGDGHRMLFRSAHIYTLMAAGINLALSFANFSLNRFDQKLAWLASILAWQAPMFITASFFLESQSSQLQRLILPLSLYALFAATVLWAWLGFKVQFRQS